MRRARKGPLGPGRGWCEHRGLAPPRPWRVTVSERDGVCAGPRDRPCLVTAPGGLSEVGFRCRNWNLGAAGLRFTAEMHHFVILFVTFYYIDLANVLKVLCGTF